MNRGEIWWVELADRKRRPYLVLSRDAAIPVLRHLVAAPLTTRRRSIPTEVDLDVADGVPKACTISLDNIETLPKWALVERLTQLSVVKQQQVCAALRHAVDC